MANIFETLFPNYETQDDRDKLAAQSAQSQTQAADPLLGGSSRNYTSDVPQSAGAAAPAQAMPQQVDDPYREPQSNEIAPQASPQPVQQPAPVAQPNYGAGGTGQMERANTELGKIGYEKGQADAALLAGHNQALDEYSKQIQANEKQKQDTYDKFLGDINANEKQIHQAELDYNKGFWADKDIATKIGAGLGYIVSAVGAAGTGKENMAWAVIQQQMKEDREKKAANYDMAVKKGQRVGGVYAAAMDRFKDKDLADKSVQLTQANQLQTMINRNASLYGSTEAIQNAKFKNGEIEQQKSMLKANLAQGMAEKYGEVYADRLKSLVDLGNGEKYTARNPEAAKDIIEKKAALDNALGYIKRIEDLNNNSGIGGYKIRTGKVGGELEANINNLATEIAVAKGTPRAALNADVVDMIRKKYIGDPKAFTDTKSYTGGQLGQLRQSLVSEFETTKRLNRMPDASIAPMLVSKRKK